MNLLKTISMKLTPRIVGLFFHVNGDGASFPLYTEAVKFIAHRYSMLSLGFWFCSSTSVTLAALSVLHLSLLFWRRRSMRWTAIIYRFLFDEVSPCAFEVDAMLS